MEMKEIRRENLRAWVATHGVPSGERSYFSQLLGGSGSFGERAARRLEEKYKMGDGFLDNTDGLGQKSNVIDISSASKARNDLVQIPQYQGVGGAMGGGVILRDQPGEIQAWNVTPEWVNKNIKNHTGIGNLCVVTGFGNSMQPLYNPGDPLIVDRGIKTVEADATYFFRVGNEGFIKILQRIPGEGIRVISKNKDYETWTIKPDMEFEIFGQVLKAWCGTDV
jgi:hypothetical protein